MLAGSLHLFRRNELESVAAHQLLHAVAEHFRHAGVGIGRVALGIDLPDPLQGRLDDPAVAFLALPQGRLGPAAFALLDGERDGIGDRAGEGLLVLQPSARRADVLVADDADHPAADADGSVEHGGDAQRLEVAGRELPGLGIGPGVVGRERPLRFESLKVGRIGRRRQLQPPRMAILAELVEGGAADRRPAGVVQPDARALDAQGLGRGARDPVEGRFEILVRRRAPGELDEHPVLLEQATLPRIWVIGRHDPYNRRHVR